MNKINLPKFHRQRFILYLLEKAGSTLSKIELQKMLFLLHQKSGFSYYDFVPYNSTYYSFQADSDLKTLQNTGWIKETDENIILLKSILSQNNNQIEISKIEYFLKQLPCSTNEEQRDSFAYKYQSNKNKQILFTIGYEGISFEAYTNRLLENDVHLVCDVRKNPFSRKFGFSKSIMLNLLQKIGIEYQHIPELGIVSAARKNLKTKADYSKLFLDYQTSLPQRKDALKQLIDLLENYKRIAITCFEKEHQMCHRHCISDYFERENNRKVVHL
jgi:hypothetical protein